MVQPEPTRSSTSSTGPDGIGPLHCERAGDVRLLVRTVLLVPLLGPLVDLDDAGLVRQLQLGRQRASEIVDETGPAKRRHRRDPLGRGLGTPDPDHLGERVDEPRVEHLRLLPSLTYERAPSGVAPLGEGPPLLDAIADRHSLTLRRDDQRPVSQKVLRGDQQVGRKLDRRRLAGAVVADAARRRERDRRGGR